MAYNIDGYTFSGYSIYWPDGLVPNQAEYGLASTTQTFRSDLTGQMQVAALPIDQWTANLTFANLEGRKAHSLRAFLASLRGRAGRFACPMFDHPMPDGTALGPGVVSGAGQTGMSLVTTGWSASQAELLLPGDYIQVGDEVKMITDTCNSGSGGESTLFFTPPLRVAPADGSAIVTANPCFVGMLQDDNQARWPVQPGKIYAMTLAVMEALDL